MKKALFVVCLVMIVSCMPIAVSAEDTSLVVIQWTVTPEPLDPDLRIEAVPITFSCDLFQVLFFLEKDLPYDEVISVIKNSAYKPIDQEIYLTVKTGKELLAEGDDSDWEDVVSAAEVIVSYTENIALWLVFTHSDETIRNSYRISFWFKEEPEDDNLEDKSALILEKCYVLFNPRPGTEDWTGSMDLPVDLDLMRELREKWEQDLALQGYGIPLSEYLQKIPR